MSWQVSWFGAEAQSLWQVRLTENLSRASLPEAGAGGALRATPGGGEGRLSGVEPETPRLLRLKPHNASSSYFTK